MLPWTMKCPEPCPDMQGRICNRISNTYFGLFGAPGMRTETQLPVAAGQAHMIKLGWAWGELKAAGLLAGYGNSDLNPAYEFVKRVWDAIGATASRMVL